MAGLLRKDRVVDYYEKVAGERLEDLAWYEAFAGVRFAIILMRMSLRAAASVRCRPPTDPDALIMFAPTAATTGFRRSAHDGTRWPLPSGFRDVKVGVA